MGFDGGAGSRGQVVHDEDIGQVVHQGEAEDHDDQAEEELVVSPADAVIEPAAVVVELVDTSVACAAVLGSVGDMRLANLALVLVLRAVEDAAKTRM